MILGLVSRDPGLDAVLASLGPARTRAKLENHLEERLLDQAQGRASYIPCFGDQLVTIPQGVKLWMFFGES